MNHNTKKLKDLLDSYKKWVSSNPQVVGDVETTIKWASYFIAGRINSSAVVSELVYSLSNLLVLFNDRVIERSRPNYQPEPEDESKLKLLLTTLEYWEVFIELSAHKLWGKRGRWLFIVAVQVAKCVGRFMLTFRYDEKIAKSPAIKPLNRKTIDQAQPHHDQKDGGDGFTMPTYAFTLKKSGKVMRRIEGAPPLHLRNWSNPLTVAPSSGVGTNSGVLMPLAEALYIAKPMIHLVAMGLFGSKSWKSYGIAFIMDLMSIRLYYKKQTEMSKQQKVELSRRCVAMLLYLMRSPFYEKYTHQRVDNFFKNASNKIPLARTICDPIMQYIPHWQETYFYMWST